MSEQYNDLIFKLGDLARECLVNRPTQPRAMACVLRAEEALVARQDELADLEDQMNEADAAYQDAQADAKAESDELQITVKKFKLAVNAVEGRVRELRKKLAAKRLEHKHSLDGVKKADERHKELEMHASVTRIEQSALSIKRLRLSTLRMGHEIQDLERQLEKALTPIPGRPGGEGILARKRQLEIEDECEQRRLDHEALLEELDAALTAKEEEVTAAEDYLDQALFLLGEECYAERISDPSLAALYPRLDKVA